MMHVSRLGQSRRVARLAGIAVAIYFAFNAAVTRYRTAPPPIRRAEALPHYSSKEAKEFVGERVMYAVLRDQQGRWASSGRYDRDVSAAPPMEPAFYTITISRADTAHVCIEAAPIPGNGAVVGPMSMDETGAVHRLAGCDTRIPREAKLATADRLLTETLQLWIRQRSVSGGAGNSFLDGEYIAPSPYYSLSVSEATQDALCLEAEPRPGAGSGLPPRSMDQNAMLYEGRGCIEASDSEPAAAPDAPRR